ELDAHRQTGSEYHCQSDFAHNRRAERVNEKETERYEKHRIRRHVEQRLRGSQLLKRGNPDNVFPMRVSHEISQRKDANHRDPDSPGDGTGKVYTERARLAFLGHRRTFIRNCDGKDCSLRQELYYCAWVG